MNRVAILPLVVGASAALGLSACGEDGISDAELERQRAQAAQNARQEVELQALKEEVRQQERSDAGSSNPGSAPAEAIESSAGQIPADAEYCGSAYAGGSASCPFVENVSDDYYASGESSSFESYSPTTGLTYTVTCNGDAPTVCTAGRAAVIYIP